MKNYSYSYNKHCPDCKKLITNHSERCRVCQIKHNWTIGAYNNSLITKKEINPLQIGSKYGLLTIIKSIYKRKIHKYFYLCQCDCGNKKVIAKHAIRIGDTTSCGCNWHKQGRLHTEKYSSSLNCIYLLYKNRATKSNLPFLLTKTQFKNITSQNCSYCGIKPAQFHKSHIKHCYGAYIYNGLDRIDSKLGYIEENVVPCCKHCNSSKGKKSLKEWLKKEESKRFSI